MPQLCSVCEDVANGFHFGVPSCKACSAFFRRTVTRKHNYECEKERRCEIVSAALFVCKGCRFAKCLRVGMRISSVQLFRDVYGKRGVGGNQTLLQHIANNYERLEDVRLQMHTSSMIGNKHPRPLNYKEVYKVFLDERLLVIDWILNSFPDFQKISETQKEILILNFYPHFVILEGGFFASRHRRGDVRFLGSGDYIDCVHLEVYYNDPEGKQPMSSKEAVATYGSSFDTYRRNVWLPMLREQVGCFEFLVILALVVFDTGIDGLSEETIEICETNRHTMRRELLDFYRTTRLENDYFIRLGHLLSIVPSLQRATCRWREVVELGKILNAYTVDSNFYDTCFGSL